MTNTILSQRNGRRNDKVPTDVKALLKKHLETKAALDHNFKAIYDPDLYDTCYAFVLTSVSEMLNGEAGIVDDKELKAFAETFYRTNAEKKKVSDEKPKARKRTKPDWSDTSRDAKQLDLFNEV